MAYNNALTKTFLVAAIMAAFTIIGSAAIEWKSVKGEKKKVEDVEEVEAEPKAVAV